MQRLFLIVASASGALAVCLGAFGAHALKESLDPHFLAIFDTAVRYHFTHTLALALLGLLMDRRKHRTLTLAGACFIAGILIFSGSLYALALSGVTWLGAITPIGGLALIAGWGLMMVGCAKSTST